MSLSRLEAIYGWINRIGPNTKTIIIIVLTIVCLEINFRDHTKLILKDYSELVQEDKQLAEEYTKMITPTVNGYIEDILIKDEDASNVLLLNYHNTLTSTHGLSYCYITSLTEKKRGLETKSCARIWKELEYIKYGDELGRINDNEYLRMDTCAKYAHSFPNLYELLQYSKAESAAFYPIVGDGGPIGMVVVLCPKPKQFYLGYYNKVISFPIQRLASLLDYNTLKGKFKKAYESGQATPERLLQR